MSASQQSLFMSGGSVLNNAGFTSNYTGTWTTPAASRSFGIFMPAAGLTTDAGTFSSGVLDTKPTFATARTFKWLLQGVNTAFQIRITTTLAPTFATLGSTSDTIGSFLSMTVDRGWYYSNNSVNADDWTITVDVRRTSDSVIVMTTSFTLHDLPI